MATTTKVFANIISSSRVISSPKYPLLKSHNLNFIIKPSIVISNRKFKSEIHTDNLYPGSTIEDRFASVDLQKLSNKSSLFSGVIPVKEIDLTYSGSSSPGGQNINKSATKVEARFKLDSASWLNTETKDILKEKWKGQLTKEGYFVVKSERTRSQQLNQADVFAKLRHAIWQALEEHKTRVEMQQVDAVEAERQRQAQMRAARERVKQKRIRSQYIKERKCTDGWDG